MSLLSRGTSHLSKVLQLVCEVGSPRIYTSRTCCSQTCYWTELTSHLLNLERDLSCWWLEFIKIIFSLLLSLDIWSGSVSTCAALLLLGFCTIQKCKSEYVHLLSRLLKYHSSTTVERLTKKQTPSGFLWIVL